MKRMELEGVIEAYKKRLEYRRAKPTMKCEEYVIEGAIDYYTKLLNAKKNGHPLAWVSIPVPTELLYVFDVIPFGPEQYCLQILSQLMRNNEGFEYIDLGEAAGLPKDACSAHKGGLGMMDSGMFPYPDFCITTAGPYDSSQQFFEVLCHRYNIPHYYIDWPHRTDGLSLAYLKKELEGMIEFLEKHTGRQFDYNKFKNMVELAREAEKYRIKTLEFRKNIPSPLGGREILSTGLCRMTMAGSPTLLNIYKTQYQEAKERVEQGKGVIPDEKYRLIWYWAYPMHNMGLVSWLEKEHKAVVVIDLLSYMDQDSYDAISDPMDFLIKRAIRNFVTRLVRNPFEDYSDEISIKCKEYNINAAVFFASWTCKQSTAMAGILANETKKIGLPFIILDGDNYDPRVLPVDEMKSKLNEFFYMLERKGIN